MHTTILSIRGVQIPINLVSSATDSIRRRVVLFKPVRILTSDPKSEFLCQLSFSCAEPTDPLNTLYAWDISHAHVTTYHPYCHSPSALTEYLKLKLCHQRAKRLGRSPSAQVEQSVPLECNICPCVWRCVQLAPVVRAICGESSYDVQVIGHVDLDVPGRRGAAELVCDGEGYRSIPLVDLKVLWYEERHALPTLHPLRGVVAGRSRDAIARSSCSSCLTLLASSSYLHPLGRVGRWYCIGIFVVLLDGRGQLIDQRDGVFTCEAKSCQVGSERGRLSTRSDRSSCRLVCG